MLLQYCKVYSHANEASCSCCRRRYFKLTQLLISLFVSLLYRCNLQLAVDTSYLEISKLICAKKKQVQDPLPNSSEAELLKSRDAETEAHGAQNIYLYKQLHGRNNMEIKYSRYSRNSISRALWYRFLEIKIVSKRAIA